MFCPRIVMISPGAMEPARADASLTRNVARGGPGCGSVAVTASVTGTITELADPVGVLIVIVPWYEVPGVRLVAIAVISTVAGVMKPEEAVVTPGGGPPRLNQ
jgi:hypothetical protein